MIHCNNPQATTDDISTINCDNNGTTGTNCICECQGPDYNIIAGYYPSAQGVTVCNADFCTGNGSDCCAGVCESLGYYTPDGVSQGMAVHHMRPPEEDCAGNCEWLESGQMNPDFLNTNPLTAYICEGGVNDGKTGCDCLNSCAGTSMEDECGCCNGEGIPEGACGCQSVMIVIIQLSILIQKTIVLESVVVLLQ